VPQPVNRLASAANARIMQLLDLTLDTPAANLALDEALLLAAEADSLPAKNGGESPDQTAVEPTAAAAEKHGEILRIWEPREFMVVVGSSSRIAEEVIVPTCRERRIEVLRRPSGGAAVLTGPGSLMYALVLDRRNRPEMRGVDSTHAWVLGRLAAAIGREIPGVARRGICDLALRERKFSGNSLRVRRDWLLYHGTLLYGFPLRLLDACLGTPPRQPAYRAGRRHSHFVMNLPLDAATLRAALCEAFEATEPTAAWPQELTAHLAAQKFSDDGWTNRF
jgi:lipoate-protein ligase A